MKPVLKAPGTMLVKLSYDGPQSNFAFNVNLRRYSMGVYLAPWYVVRWPWTSNTVRFFTLLDAATARFGANATLALHGIVFLVSPFVVCLLVGGVCKTLLATSHGII